MQQHRENSLFSAGGCDGLEGARAFSCAGKKFLGVRNSQKPGAVAAFAASIWEDFRALSIVWAIVGGATVAGKVGCVASAPWRRPGGSSDVLEQIRARLRP